MPPSSGLKFVHCCLPREVRDAFIIRGFHGREIEIAVLCPDARQWIHLLDHELQP
jgi:hypothetical protein